MSQLETFREEARAWILEVTPKSLYGSGKQGAFDGFWGGRKETGTADERAWCAIMAERGWTAPTWPKDYGGGGLGVEEARALREIYRELKLPLPLVGFGLIMLGPVLLRYGTEAQKRAHLPGIVRGEIRWCQGYSEPAAGSDLAALRCAAVRVQGPEGDSYRVSGQKIWTSHADKSDWIFCLVRTNTEVKKQAGISFVLIDMQSPGVEARPITLISGASPFCEVFFEDVEVPIANRVHEENAGWTVAKALLQHERSMIGEAIAGQMTDSEGHLIDLARRHRGPAEGPLDGALRDRVARCAIDEQCHLLTVQRVRQMQAAGEPGTESSVLKICGSEAKQARHELAMEIAGAAALGWEAPTHEHGGFEDTDLKLTRAWLRSRANSIEGGSTEIQLNILARHVLGLPR